MHVLNVKSGLVPPVATPLLKRLAHTIHVVNFTRL